MYFILVLLNQYRLSEVIIIPLKHITRFIGSYCVQSEWCVVVPMCPSFFSRTNIYSVFCICQFFFVSPSFYWSENLTDCFTVWLCPVLLQFISISIDTIHTHIHSTLIDVNIVLFSSLRLGMHLVFSLIVKLDMTIVHCWCNGNRSLEPYAETHSFYRINRKWIFAFAI